MLKMTKVDVVPRKKTKSSEIVKLFDEFLVSENKSVIVESDYKYSKKGGLYGTLRTAAKKYGYFQIEVIYRDGVCYLSRKDL